MMTEYVAFSMADGNLIGIGCDLNELLEKVTDRHCGTRYVEILNFGDDAVALDAVRNKYLLAHFRGAYPTVFRGDGYWCDDIKSDLEIYRPIPLEA